MDKTLNGELRDAEERLAESRARLRAHLAELRANWRRRIEPKVLLGAGLLVGALAEQLAARYSRKPQDAKRHDTRRMAHHARRLLPLAQLAALHWLRSHSPRSISRADHSSNLSRNGLSLH